MKQRSVRNQSKSFCFDFILMSHWDHCYFLAGHRIHVFKSFEESNLNGCLYVEDV